MQYNTGALDQKLLALAAGGDPGNKKLLLKNGMVRLGLTEVAILSTARNSM